MENRSDSDQMDSSDNAWKIEVILIRWIFGKCMENSSDSDQMESSDNAWKIVAILIRWILRIMQGK